VNLNNIFNIYVSKYRNLYYGILFKFDEIRIMNSVLMIKNSSDEKIHNRQLKHNMLNDILAVTFLCYINQIYGT